MSVSVPGKPPQNVTAHNTSSTSIFVQWKPIPTGYTYGILRGYLVSYEKSGTDNWSEVTINSDITSLEIKGLRKYAKYVVQVQGFTSKGRSIIMSKAVVLKTDQDGKYS
jgi:hypothetical protein